MVENLGYMTLLWYPPEDIQIEIKTLTREKTAQRLKNFPKAIIATKTQSKPRLIDSAWISLCDLPISQ